jgi:Secretion system C-terminal sorting domain/Metallo-peptidase family M12
MKNITFRAVLSILTFVFSLNSLYSQTCGSHQHFDEFINNEVKEGRLTPEEGRKRLDTNNNHLQTRSDVVNVLIVHHNVTSVSLSLPTAQGILNSCASARAGCGITYNVVNATPLSFNFTSSNDGSTMLGDLLNTANAQNWYSSTYASSQGWNAAPDLVIGITGTNMVDGTNTGLAGYANIGRCTPATLGPALVIEQGTTNHLFAHELGHTVGMEHDPTSTTSLMSPTVYTSSVTMSQTNKDCYTTGAGCALLPIELMAFTGSFFQNKNNLTWTTASEKNNKGFQIERSYDTKHWLSIGYVKGSGNSETELSYKFEDASPLGLSYYRLRQQDFDGKETFSIIISIKSESKTKVLIAPNPVRSDLVISFESETYAEEVNVYDVLGRTVAQYKKPSSRLEVDMQQAQAGMYIVEITMEGKRIREKILKVNE